MTDIGMDMTQGKPSAVLIRFALPLMLTSLLQQAYTLCDSVVVGQLLGANAFAAVGSASFLYNVPLNILLGCTQGFGIVIARKFGAKRTPALRRGFRTATLLSVSTGLLLSILGVFLLSPLLAVMGTPAELMDDCRLYLSCLWAGLPITAALNMEASALRAIGNSQAPLRALLLSSLVNIALDILLVALFRTGVIGTALATVLSQLFAAVYCMRAIWKSDLKTPGRENRGRFTDIRELLRMGVPPALSYGVTAIAGSLYQTVINGYGIAVITGLSVTNRYFDLLNIVGYGMEGATATFVGQNAGAQRYLRVREGVKKAALIGVAASIVIHSLAYLAARPLTLLFLPNSAAEAVSVGVAALRAKVVFFGVLYLLCIYRAAIQGLGNACIPMISGFGELILKIAAVYILPAWFGSSGLYYVDAAAWVPVTVFLCASYSVQMRKNTKMCVPPGIDP